MIVEEIFIQLGALVKIVIPNLKINTVTSDWSMLRDKLKSSLFQKFHPYWTFFIHCLKIKHMFKTFLMSVQYKQC